MSDYHLESLEQRLFAAGRDFPYPPTPDLATIAREQIEAKKGSRSFPRARLAWALAIFLVVASILFAVPPVRAQILEFLQIGAIRIFSGEPTPSPVIETPDQTPTEDFGAAPATATPPPVRLTQGIPAIQDLVQETSLQEAQELAGFPLKLPEFPEALGAPDEVYFVDLNGPAVLTLWMDPAAHGQAALSLLQLGPGAFAGKGAPGTIEEVEVGGNRGIWMEGAHILYLRVAEGDYKDIQIPIEGNILVWTEGVITYRLEGDYTKEEALRIATSLAPLE